MSNRELCLHSATELSARIRSGALSARELMEAHLAQVEVVEPKVNAFVTLAAESALAQAEAADKLFAARRGERASLPPLHGMPIAVKDLIRTRGIRTTFGSTLYADFVPDADDLLAERYRAAGAIVIGKTNTPEFGCGGGQTTNAVCGDTRNPYDLTRACGSSSGGAAVALAARLAPLADGSDFGGSLRHPAGHCNVVGFRPTPGRVPAFPAELGWFTLRTDGPMGRTVADTALLLSVQAGPDPRSPIALPEPGEAFAVALQRDFAGARVAFSPDLGFLPVDSRVRDIFERQRAVLQDLGLEVIDAAPDLRAAPGIFRVLRAWRYTLTHGERVRDPAKRAVMKPDLVRNTEQGFELSAEDVARAEGQRTELFYHMREFMDGVDFLVIPTNPTPPLPIGQTSVEKIDGKPMTDYLEGGALKSAISTVGNPAISVPAGFTPEGWPVGVQIVGPHCADLSVLQFAHAFEQATRVGERLPALLDDTAS